MLLPQGFFLPRRDHRSPPDAAAGRGASGGRLRAEPTRPAPL